MKRASGVLMHVSSLWGEYSEGSFGKAAKEWIDFLAGSGFSYWQTLPFCLPDSFNSPYSSYSTFSVNPNFIDLALLGEAGLLTAEELESAKQRTPYLCEFARLHDERFRLLSLAAKRFGDRGAIDEFLNAHPHTADFCRFMALREANNKAIFTEWTVNEPVEWVLSTWEFICYTFFEQWKEIKSYANRQGISIIGDIPIYVSYNSSDVWSAPEQFDLDERLYPKRVAGVPPDYFCEDGQLWGNPLYNWKKMKEDGYSFWCDRVSFMCELFDGVRIDHFRGLESYYAIPADATSAKNGKWVKGPGLPFIEALKKVCGEKLLIAEDLGVITDEVREMVTASGCPGMRVLQFAFMGDPDSPHLPHNYEKNCIAYTGTHDNNTLLGYVWELDMATRRRLLAYCGYTSEAWDSKDAYAAILRTMFASAAGLLILPVQDLLLYGRDTRLNTPGNCAENNWGWRITREQFHSLDRSKFKTLNQLYSRS